MNAPRQAGPGWPKMLTVEEAAALEHADWLRAREAKTGVAR